MTGTGLNITGSAAPGVTSVGGIVTIKSLSQLQAEEQEAEAAAVAANTMPVIQGLAGHVRRCWESARRAKENTVEQRMLQSLRQRRGEYDPDKLAQIHEQGGTAIYMMLTANKCRSAGAWLRDVLMTTSRNKPWSIQPGGMPDLSPDILQSIMQTATAQIEQFEMQNGPMSPQDIRQLLLNLKDQASAQVHRVARAAADRMEAKMLDQLQEGGFMEALSDFIDDITTFPSAIIKGPVIRKKQRLAWVKSGDNQYTPDVKEEMVLEWERVDPFNFYPAADATKIEDGYMIERHRLSRSDLNNMLGVEGYSDQAIRQVLDQYSKGRYDWLGNDTEKASIEGKSTSGVMENPSELIDALQFWGSVQGKMLIEWGLPKGEIEDPLKEYNVEVWLVGEWVIKAVLNTDPMGRKPYYKSSYEEVPGSFWGHSVTDLCRDTQDVCNAAARALINNMSIASGPQVVFNVDRLPQGENITQMFPWKTWQVTSDPYNGTQKMVDFFQPGSNAAELLGIYDRFAALADEYTGIPRYMTGDSPTGGAGRTASGMSMLMSNAGKSIKQVISSIDQNVIEKAICRLYYYNMKYGDDPDLKGDVNIVANGAEALMAQEQTQQRRNEFLQMALQSEVVHQVVGMEGIAAILRENAKNLGMNVNEIVPPLEILKERWHQQQLAVQQQQQQMMLAAAQQGGANPDGSQPNAMQGGAQLADGRPVTNQFAPS
jgi:hypothetical protein